MAVLWHLGQQSVGIDNDLRRFRLIDDDRLEGRAEPDVAADRMDAIEVEEDVGLSVVGDAIPVEQRPLGEILVPVAEFHIEAAIHGRIVHLAHKALAVGHGARPFRAVWGDGHRSLLEAASRRSSVEIPS